MPNPRTARRCLVAGVMVAGALLTLGGCGVRGSLDNPARVEGQGGQATAAAESGQGKREGEAPKPHQGFILDGLLR